QAFADIQKIDSFVVQDGFEAYPVSDVSWYGAMAYAKWRKGTLPTEAQWEYAARGGPNPSDTSWIYAGGIELRQVGWYDLNSDSDVHIIGKKLPNDLGLHDLSGNLWEWCYDWYNEEGYKSDSVVSNPQGATSGSYRVLRGGSWLNAASFCRVANRGSRDPSQMFYFNGFRMVRLR
ncbi:MAG: SUMF1/EgtB/PvdO family nonheme iron enzyme, partial [Bacteroidota bacterium]